MLGGQGEYNLCPNCAIKAKEVAEKKFPFAGEASEQEGDDES
jgi:hypothetical protein